MGQGLGSRPWTVVRCLHCLGCNMGGCEAGCLAGCCVESGLMDTTSGSRGGYGSCCFRLGPGLLLSVQGPRGLPEARHSRPGRAQGHRTGRLGAVSGLSCRLEFLCRPQRLLSGSGGGQAAEAGRPVLMDSGGDGLIQPVHGFLPPARHVWSGKNHFSYFVFITGPGVAAQWPIYLRLDRGRGTGGGDGGAGGVSLGSAPETRARSSVRSHLVPQQMSPETCSLGPLNPVQRALHPS